MAVPNCSSRPAYYARTAIALDSPHQLFIVRRAQLQLFSRRRRFFRSPPGDRNCVQRGGGAVSMRWHWTTVVALGWLTAVLLPGRLCAQDPLYWKRNAPADARAIQITAGDAVTWQEGERRVFLLSGNVWIEQSDAHIKAPQAVVWVDEAAKKQSGIY